MDVADVVGVPGTVDVDDVGVVVDVVAVELVGVVVDVDDVVNVAFVADVTDVSVDELVVATSSNATLSSSGPACSSSSS